MSYVLPNGWGYPSSLFNYETLEYENGGLLWYGKERCTKAEIDNLKAHTGENVRVDFYTLVGKDDERWTTWREQNKHKPQYKQVIIIG